MSYTIGQIINSISTGNYYPTNREVLEIADKNNERELIEASMVKYNFCTIIESTVRNDGPAFRLSALNWWGTDNADDRHTKSLLVNTGFRGVINRGDNKHYSIQNLSEHKTEFSDKIAQIYANEIAENILAIQSDQQKTIRENEKREKRLQEERARYEERAEKRKAELDREKTEFLIKRESTGFLESKPLTIELYKTFNRSPIDLNCTESYSFPFAPGEIKAKNEPIEQVQQAREKIYNLWLAREKKRRNSSFCCFTTPEPAPFNISLVNNRKYYDLRNG